MASLQMMEIYYGEILWRIRLYMLLLKMSIVKNVDFFLFVMDLVIKRQHMLLMEMILKSIVLKKE